MKTCIYICFAIILSAISVQPIYTQEVKGPPRLTGLLSPTDLKIMYWTNAELQTVDTTFLEVVYDLNYRRQSNSGIYFNMLTVLQLGIDKQKYYSMIRQFTDDIMIDVFQKMKGVAAVPGAGAQHTYTEDERRIEAVAGVDWLNSEIWMDLPSRRLTERMHDYKQFNRSLEYEEPIPGFEWRFTTQTDTICGYPCFAAATTFRGRDWTVWYTPEIPVSAGPWKFNGLPGLILRAQDSMRDYVWECRDISRESKQIVYYKVDSQLLSRQKWRRYLRQLHDDPLGMLGENGQREFYIKGKLVTPEDNWQIPYNPIELE